MMSSINAWSYYDIIDIASGRVWRELVEGRFIEKTLEDAGLKLTLVSRQKIYVHRELVRAF